MLPSEAASEIVANRRGVYGHPAEVYAIWAKMIEPILGVPVSVEQAAMLLILLKCAREHNAQYPATYRDNLDDIAGYANVLFMVKERVNDGSSTTSS